MASALALTLPRARTAAVRSRRAVPGDGAIIGGLSWLLYLAAGWVLVVMDHSIIGDAWSRVANAFYVLFSRDPHLAAIGFVWNPLPSLAVLPLLPLKAIWPDMVATGFAATIVSSICMAWSVRQVHEAAADLGLARRHRLLVTASFALNPMIVYYGANGMSEAMFVLTLLIAARYLTRWARANDDTGALVVSALAIAAGYMARYEAAVAAMGGLMAVILVRTVRADGPLRRRIASAGPDALVFVTPFVMSFASFALAGLLIVGQPFEQFTSAYGVVAQMTVAQSSVAAFTGQGTGRAVLWVVGQVLGLEPGIVILAVLGIIATLRGRLTTVAPSVAIVGSVGVFAVLDFLTGRTLGWLRYFITLIPLATMLVIALLSPDGHGAGPIAEIIARLKPQWPRRVTAAVALATLVVALPVGARTMLDPAMNPPDGGEAFQLAGLLTPAAQPGGIAPTGQYDVGGQIARFLDRMHLPRGSVLVDGAMGFPVILESGDPAQFVTTPDRDFEQALADPAGFGIRYLLVPQDVGYQSLDALNRAYPGIYASGAGVGRLVRQFSSGGNTWRLYAVV